MIIFWKCFVEEFFENLLREVEAKSKIENLPNGSIYKIGGHEQKGSTCHFHKIELPVLQDDERKIQSVDGSDLIITLNRNKEIDS